VSEQEKNNWFREAVVYQIYPLSFKDTSGNGKGDLRGIIEKLDYLSDGTPGSLGVNAIWLSPIYKSPMRDFGYDVSDYYDIDPLFGDLATFDEFIKKAHDRGIKVLMDFIPNHTSSDHKWFQESKSSRTNPKRDWYVWRDPKSDGAPPNNWLSFFGGSAWTYDNRTDQYYLHNFLEDQPDLNWWNEEVVKEMSSVMQFWMDRGVDGFRTDAVAHLMEDAQFRDDPVNPYYVEGRDIPYNKLIHTYSQSQEATIKTVGNFCKVIGQDTGKYMVSEVYLGVEGMMKYYEVCADRHSPFNFNLLSLPWKAGDYRGFIDDFESHLTENDWPNYVYGNHDRSRIITRLGDARARLAAMLLLTLRGMPFIYYGEELGMEDYEMPDNCVKDPFEKQCPGFGVGRDPERTPMQWDDSENAGFTNAKPWLPVHPNYKRINVQEQSSNPTSMFSLYRTLIHFRKSSPGLKTGKYHSVGDKEHVFAFTRECSEEKILVVLNFTNDEQVMNYHGASGTIVCSTNLDRPYDQQVNLENIKLRGNEGCIIRCKGAK
jgi:alpha-glucosidase